MVCQLLAGLGVSFGDPADLLPGDRWNAGGYLEAKPVMDVNSRIITGLSRFGSRPGAFFAKLAYLGMPGPATIAARAERQRAAVEELGRRYRSCAVKDPRFCLTLRWWHEWTHVQAVVVCMRQPADVVASLARRHHLPRWLGARFYAWHVDSLLAQLPGLRVAFVDVDALAADDAAELDSLRTELGLSAGPPSARLLADVVKPELYASANGASPAAGAATAAWRRLGEAAAARRRRPADVEGR